MGQAENCRRPRQLALNFIGLFILIIERVNGKYPAIPALKGEVKGYNMKKTPCRKAPPFRAESFALFAQPYFLCYCIGCLIIFCY
jgi:hypothetical protein